MSGPSSGVLSRVSAALGEPIILETQVNRCSCGGFGLSGLNHFMSDEHTPLPNRWRIVSQWQEDKS